MVWTSDDESDLEVLPPPSKKPLSKRGGEGRPSLSYSGASSKDPVNLLLDDYDTNVASSSSSFDNCENAVNRKTQQPKTDTARFPSKPMNASKRNVFDNGDDSSVDSLAALEAKVKRRKPPRKPGHDDPLLSSTKGDLRTKKPTAAGNEKKAPKPTSKNITTAVDSTTMSAKVTKAAEKKRAADERKRQRELKKIADEAEKQSKKRHVQRCQQLSGKLAQEEIAILLDTSFHHTEAAGQKDPQWVVDLLQQKGPRLRYLTVDHRSALPGTAVVQWIRKNALDGGAIAAVDALHSKQHKEYEHIAVVAIVVDIEILLTLLERNQGDDNYPKLAEWIQGVEIGWRTSWKKTNAAERPRIILLLDGVQEALERKWTTKSRKRKARTEPRAFLPTMEEFHDALTWILIEYRVDSVHCKTQEAITMNVTKATRMLSERRYITETSELECIKKIPQHCHPDDPDDIRIQDTFCRQLQQVPRVSRLMALSVASNYYPSLQSLWEDYASDNHDQRTKEHLLAPMFNERSHQLKLAKHVHTILTSDDPAQILD